MLTSLKAHVHLTVFVKCSHTLSNPSLLEIAKWLLNPSFLLPQCMVVGDGFHTVVLDVANLAIQHLVILVVSRTPAFLVNQILALVVFIWTIVALVLFILLSPILGVIALTILKSILQVARMLEARKEVGNPDMVCTILIKEGQGNTCGYYNPCQLPSMPTLYIQ
jgi:hypothetical protein